MPHNDANFGIGTLGHGSAGRASSDASYSPHPALMNSSSLQGDGEAMKASSLAVVMAVVAVTTTLAHAEDMAEVGSRSRHQPGLSAGKTDPQLTAIAQRQGQGMAASGIMDPSVAGSFSSRISGLHLGIAAENIATGSKTWPETFRMWQNSPGHNANLLLARADSVGVAVARNEQTRYKTFWALVIAEKSPKKKEPKVAAAQEKAPREKVVEHNERSASAENPLSMVKNFVCKYLCQ